MRTKTEARAERAGVISRLRRASPEQAEQAAASAAVARERIDGAGGVRALPPAAYRAERAAMLARLRNQ